MVASEYAAAALAAAAAVAAAVHSCVPGLGEEGAC